MRLRSLWQAFATIPLMTAAVFGQGHQPTPAQRQQSIEDPAAVERGRSLFKSSCGFCHGNDATGERGPDLLRSPITLHDDSGNLLGPIIHNGRPDKGMPSFSSMKDDQVSDIVAFLHHQANSALHSAHVPGDYPLAKLLTGNAASGKEFFYGPGGCSQCHSVTGDLAGVAKKYSPIDLQQNMVYPPAKKVDRMATVTAADGTKFHGKVLNEDEFNLGVVCDDGWYRSWPLADIKAEIQDPLARHRELTGKYSDADLHNVFAFLETLK